ncbi:MAG: hypothetical protein IPG67_12070 [Acidobacteria bacterium]|nr:hypothetical protein [Acidobacteriota bacterium]
MKPLKRKKGNERIRLLVMQLLVSFMFVTQAFGIGLADYLSKLEAARSDVDVLIADVENTRTGKRNLVRSEAVILRIRETLPPGLKIDVPGGIIESDTQWLIAELDDLESRVNLSEKTAVLVGIKERLDSIADRLDELNQAAASERSKDEDKQKLAEILRRRVSNARTAKREPDRTMATRANGMAKECIPKSGYLSDKRLRRFVNFFCLADLAIRRIGGCDRFSYLPVRAVSCQPTRQKIQK